LQVARRRMLHLDYTVPARRGGPTARTGPPPEAPYVTALDVVPGVPRPRWAEDGPRNPTLAWLRDLPGV